MAMTALNILNYFCLACSISKAGVADFGILVYVGSLKILCTGMTVNVLFLVFSNFSVLLVTVNPEISNFC